MRSPKIVSCAAERKAAVHPQRSKFIEADDRVADKPGFNLSATNGCFRLAERIVLSNVRLKSEGAELGQDGLTAPD